MNRYRILLFIFSSLFCQPGVAQKTAGIKTSADKSRILIGEPLVLTVEITTAANNSLPIPEMGSFEHFEFLQPVRVDSIFKAGNKTIKIICTLTSFDSGRWVIPAIALNSKIKSEPVPVDVVFAAFNPQQDYHDIKDIIEVKPGKEKKNWLWYVLAAAVVVPMFIYFLLRKKKPAAPALQQPALNAYEEAMKQLAGLEKNKLEAKELHTRLVDVFRLYVLRKKNILSLQKTTDGLVGQLQSVITEKEYFIQLQQALRLSDYVKFAKYTPSSEDNSGAIESIKNTIRYIEQND
jgi:hypothetical protein